MANASGGMQPPTTPNPAVASAQPTGPQVDDQSKTLKRGSIWIARAISYLVYAYLLVVEVILLLGFLLLLFGANPSSSFVEWAYRNLERAMRPFRGIFAPVEIGTAGNDVPAIFDTSIMFAMIIYAVVAIAVSAVIAWLTSRINRVDRELALAEAQERHQRELQALRDQATIAQAQHAEWAAAQRAGATPPPRPPGT